MGSKQQQYLAIVTVLQLCTLTLILICVPETCIYHTIKALSDTRNPIAAILFSQNHSHNLRNLLLRLLPGEIKRISPGYFANFAKIK